MCAKKEPQEVYQSIADLDIEVPAIREVALTGQSRNGGAWVGALAFYGLLENV